VLVNPIVNAVKFTRIRPRAEIEIGCEEQRKNLVVVFVRDNGVGFDKKYLNSCSDFSGGFTPLRRLKASASGWLRFSALCIGMAAGCGRGPGRPRPNLLFLSFRIAGSLNHETNLAGGRRSERRGTYLDGLGGIQSGQRSCGRPRRRRSLRLSVLPG
jgi:hypothetical protein